MALLVIILIMIIGYYCLKMAYNLEGQSKDIRRFIMEQFLEALPAFGIGLGLWVVGFMILDPQSFTRFFK